jgi:hypothetical protein
MSQEHDTIMHIRSKVNHYDWLHLALSSPAEPIWHSHLRLGSRQRNIAVHAFVQQYKDYLYMTNFVTNLASHLSHQLNVHISDTEIMSSTVSSYEVGKFRVFTKVDGCLYITDDSLSFLADPIHLSP